MPITIEPATIKYECKGCGDCCRMPFPIYLRPEEAQFLDDVKWLDTFDYLNTAEKVVPTKDPSGRSVHRLAKQSDGRACVFLGEDNQCLVHQEFGEASKPAACKVFPRTAVAMQGQRFAHYALLCRCVELNLDPTVLYQELQEADQQVVADRKVELKSTAGKTIGSKPYQDVCEDIAAIFDHESLTLLQAVQATQKYFGLNLSGDPNLESGKMMREAMRESLPVRVSEMHFSEKMDDTQRALFFQILFYALNPGPVNFFEQSLTQQSLTRDQRQKQGEAFRDEKGRPVLENQELSITFADVRNMKLSIQNSELKKMIRSFLITKLIGLRYYQEHKESIIVALNVLLLSVAEVIWTAKALAAEEKAETASSDHVMHAIRLVDNSVGILDSAMFSGKMKEAWQFLFGETDFASAALAELMSE